MKIDRNDGIGSATAAVRKAPQQQTRSQFVRRSMQQSSEESQHQPDAARPRNPKRLPADIRAAKM